MVIGTGIDLVQIVRIEQILDKYPEIFPSKILGSNEMSVYRKITKQHKAAYLAKRFSAKESLIKAVASLNIDIRFLDAEILNSSSGKPFFLFAENSILNQYKIDISVSDDYPCAVSIVIISSLN